MKAQLTKTLTQVVIPMALTASMIAVEVVGIMTLIPHSEHKVQRVSAVEEITVVAPRRSEAGTREYARLMENE